MNPGTQLADALKALPPPARKALYTVLGLAGVVLAVCGLWGVDDLGPVTLEQALQAYAFLSAATGGVAFANVGPRVADDPPLTDFDEDVDLSTFEPVGLATDVYGESPA